MHEPRVRNMKKSKCEICQFESDNGKEKHSFECSRYKSVPYADFKLQSSCVCACHENKLEKAYVHDTKCCDTMNGYVDQPQEMRRVERKGVGDNNGYYEFTAQPQEQEWEDVEEEGMYHPHDWYLKSRDRA